MQYKMVDVNDTQAKQETQRLQSLRTQVVLWLIVLALGIMLIPLMLITRWVRTDVSRLETELLTIQNAMIDASAPSAEVMNLGAEVSRLDQLNTTLQTVTLPSGVNWPIVMDATLRYDEDAIEIVTLTQAENKIQIAGRAISNDAVVRYQQTLLDSDAFVDVVVLSMSTVPAEPTAAPPDAAESTDATDENAIQPPIGNVEFVIDLELKDLSAGSSTP